MPQQDGGVTAHLIQAEAGIWEEGQRRGRAYPSNVPLLLRVVLGLRQLGALHIQGSCVLGNCDK